VPIYIKMESENNLLHNGAETRDLGKTIYFIMVTETRPSWYCGNQSVEPGSAKSVDFFFFFHLLPWEEDRIQVLGCLDREEHHGDRGDP